MKYESNDLGSRFQGLILRKISVLRFGFVYYNEEMEKPIIHSKPVRLFFFWSGIIATFCYRVIVIVNNYSYAWAQAFWYMGTIGFIVYFAHRYQISERRAKLIRDYRLVGKVKNLKGLSEGERDALGYIFDTLRSSKEKWNSIFIFVSSFVALTIGFYLDFLK